MKLLNSFVIYLKLVASYQYLGTFDLKHIIYAGEGWANGLGSDPETLGFPYTKSICDMGVVEVFGNPFDEIPVPKRDPRNLESLLVRNLTG